MSLAGHVPRAMPSRYSYVWNEANRREFDEIAACQCAADERRNVDMERREQDALLAQSAAVQ